ncbi:MAG: hypothetical protein KDD67_14115 [Ignavibacteriae bacterium]|nr:hypothetical protein [Ignavibacteriota bacterium]MCB9216076.1 hypothetical protein [Ignavibacteria bacterium]
MKRLFTLAVPSLLSFIAPLLLWADPPDPEDVLNPVPDPESYFFLQPYIGLGYSFLTTDPIRPQSGTALGEVTNAVIESGSGIGFDIGIDFGFVSSEHWATRIGFFYNRRALSNSDTLSALCTTPLGSFNETVNLDYCVVGDYIGMQAQVDYRLSDFFGYLGFASSLPLKVSYEETDAIVDTSSICSYLFDGVDATKVLTGSVSENPLADNLRHNLKVGAGYIHELGDETDLVFQLQYEHPLSNLFTTNQTVILRNAEFEGSRTIPVTVNGGARFGTLTATLGIRFNHITTD